MIRQAHPGLMAPTEVIDLPAESLTSEERERLQADEETIHRGMRAWLDAGMALERIRDQRLYRETHGSFEVYCWEKFGLRKPNAYRKICAAAKYREALPVANSLQIRFTAESQFRPLMNCQAATLTRVLNWWQRKSSPMRTGTAFLPRRPWHEPCASLRSHPLRANRKRRGAGTRHRPAARPARTRQRTLGGVFSHRRHFRPMEAIRGRGAASPAPTRANSGPSRRSWKRPLNRFPRPRERAATSTTC